MPKQVLYGEEGFNWLQHNLVRRGFRLVEHFETRKMIDRLGLLATRPFKPRTAVLIFSEPNGGYEVKVRTSYNREAKNATQSANGWVMITSGDRRVYTDRPFNRTQRFLHNLLESAALARQRVIHRPECDECKAAMNIVRGRSLKQVYFRCPNGCMTKPWDEPIKDNPEAMERVRKRRKRHRQTDKRTRAKGKEPHQAMLKRAANPSWVVTRPGNQRR